MSDTVCSHSVHVRFTHSVYHATHASISCDQTTHASISSDHATRASISCDKTTRASISRHRSAGIDQQRPRHSRQCIRGCPSFSRGRNPRRHSHGSSCGLTCVFSYTSITPFLSPLLHPPLKPSLPGLSTSLLLLRLWPIRMLTSEALSPAVCGLRQLLRRESLLRTTHSLRPLLFLTGSLFECSRWLMSDEKRPQEGHVKVT